MIRILESDWHVRFCVDPAILTSNFLVYCRINLFRSTESDEVPS